MTTQIDRSSITSKFSSLENKNVLVTGGSSGIGQAISVRLANEGANVAINYHTSHQDAKNTENIIQSIKDCADEVESCGSDSELIKADVSDEGDVIQMVDKVIDTLGGIDILINNAGIQISQPSDKTEVDQFDKVIAVNLRGAFLCARQVLRHWIDQGTSGSIINISSVHEIIPKPKFIGYSCSKGGMQNLTRTLALEYAKFGIRVNGVGPGATITPINQAWIEDPEKKAMVEDHIPMNRAGEAEEMAATAAFLASDEAAYITGQTLFVDGGLTLYPDFQTAWSSE